MVELTFKATVRQWGNSFIVSIPMSFITNDLVKDNHEYKFSFEEVKKDGNE